MLVLNRKPNESIILGGVVRITVLETRGDDVRIGIEAPAEVAILCEEPGPPRPDAPKDEPGKAR
jgi:carbon storage regulator